MFNRKIKCHCGNRISNGYSFCPFCGCDLRMKGAQETREAREGKEPDNLFDAIDQMQMPFMLRFPFKKLVKEIEKQMVVMDREIGKEMKTEKMQSQAKPLPSNFAQGISISINSSSGGMPVIKVKQFGPEGAREINTEEKQEKEKTSQIKEPTKAEREKLEKFAKLPRHEPKTTVRRLSDCIIYEVSLPGIKDKSNIIINKLQNSIEIKAFTKDRAYFKLIPLAWPIKRHYLENEKLVLELNPKI